MQDFQPSNIFYDDATDDIYFIVPSMHCLKSMPHEKELTEATVADIGEASTQHVPLVFATPISGLAA